MASSGNGGGGGCLSSIIVVIVMLILPAWIMGDDFSLGGLFAWNLVLFIICLIIFVISQSNKPNQGNNSNQSSNINRKIENKNKTGNYRSASNTIPKIYTPLRVTADNKNVSIYESYKGKLEIKSRLERDIDKINKEQIDIKKRIDDYAKSREELLAGKEKPFLMSKTRYISQHQAEIDNYTSVITERNHQLVENEKLLKEKEDALSRIKYINLEDSNKAFETLKYDFEQLKLSEGITGNVDIKNSAIPKDVQYSDLKNIQYKVNPYGILLNNYRFYFFPKGIWVFEGNAQFVGVYKPKAISCAFSSRDKTDFGFGDTKFFSDSTIVRTRNTWLHTCRDGTPDLRYRDNPMRTYTTYKECSLDINICGCMINLVVSSENKCIALKTAIDNYSKVKENQNMIPLLISLLERCDAGDSIDHLKEMMIV